MKIAIKPKSITHSVKYFFDSIQKFELLNFKYTAWIRCSLTTLNFNNK